MEFNFDQFIEYCYIISFLVMQFFLIVGIVNAILEMVGIKIKEGTYLFDFFKNFGLFCQAKEYYLHVNPKTGEKYLFSGAHKGEKIVLMKVSNNFSLFEIFKFILLSIIPIVNFFCMMMILADTCRKIKFLNKPIVHRSNYTL